MMTWNDRDEVSHVVVICWLDAFIIALTKSKLRFSRLTASQLWYKYTKSAFNTLRVQYNNAFRAMLSLPWRCSASGMFAENRVTDFYGLMRRLRASFITRRSVSGNKIISVIFRSIYLFRYINCNS